MRSPRAFLRDTRAVAAAEFALVVPVFIILVFGTINAGLAMSAVTQMHYAAERSARCLAVDVQGACTAGDIGTYAQTYYNGPAVSGLYFEADADAACGRQVVGKADYEILTGFSSTAFTITATACYPLI
jgi:Flp pilus assembly protein TadG